MSKVTTNLLAAAAIGQAVGLLGWIDPLFLPLVLVGPLVTGALTAAKGVSYGWIAVLWFSVGINMLWTDWAINGEDQLFHLAVALITPLLAGTGYGAVRLSTRERVSR